MFRASLVALAFLVSCQGEPPAPTAPVPKLENRADGLTYAEGAAEPFTGTWEKRDKGGTLARSESYKAGKPHGDHSRYYPDGKPRKIETFSEGEKVRERRWFENGNLEIDAEMKNGVAYGKHTRWFEDGSLRFEAIFVEGLKWQGRVRDFKPDGTVVVDAIFENGKYIRGIFPDAPEGAVQEAP